MQNRRIYLTTEINSESYEKFSRRLFKLTTDFPGEPIDIILNSPGGSAYDAMAIYSGIRTCINCNPGLEIDVVAVGLVASAATLILVAGTRRFMAREAWVMVHEDTTVASETDKVTDIERIAKHSRRIENQWNSLLAKHTKLTAAEWTELNKTDLYLTADECLAYGIVDEVI